MAVLLCFKAILLKINWEIEFILEIKDKLCLKFGDCSMSIHESDLNVK